MQVNSNFNTTSFSAYRIGQNDEEKRKIAQQILNIQDKNIREQVVDTLNKSIDKLNAETTSSGYIDFSYTEPKEGKRGNSRIQIKKQWTNGYCGLAYGDKCLIDENDPHAVSTKDLPKRITSGISQYIKLEQERAKLTDKEQNELYKIYSMLV